MRGAGWVAVLILVMGCGQETGKVQGSSRPYCGDGHLDDGEACDAGPANRDDVADACRSRCVPASCGDGTRDTGEACDGGQGNSDELPDACRRDCSEARCGDGVVDTGEACDQG